MDYKDLKIWQNAIDLTVDVYKIVDKFPDTEKYGLISQLIRSCNSIGANIAESCGRFHYKDRINFLYHSRGSLFETEHHLIISNRLGFLSDSELNRLVSVVKDLGIKLNNFIKTIELKLN